MSSPELPPSPMVAKLFFAATMIGAVLFIGAVVFFIL